jgi:hypothetical protein
MRTNSSLLTFAAILAAAGNLLAQVPNDEPTSALVVANGVNGPYTNVGATTSAVAPWPCAAGGNDVWFTYISGAAGSLTADLCTLATYDSALQILDSTFNSLGCNDDFCGLQSSVTATLAGPGTYYIRVGGWNGNTGAFSMNVNGPGGPAGSVIATNTTLGAGCGANYASFYELFTSSAAIDLSNTAFQMIFTGSGYVVVPAAPTFVAPSATAQNLGLADDNAAPVTLSSAFPFPGGTTTSFEVCSNGHVNVATNGAAVDYTPSATEFLNWTNPSWAVWRDFICNATGNVKFEEVAGVAYITWDNVVAYQGGTAGTTPSTFQLQFNLATGTVTFVFQSMDTVSVSNFGNNCVVGYSGPGASLNPGATDLSALTAITTSASDVPALSLAGTSRPVIGTNWDLSVSNVPATGLIGIDVFGLSDPGINDLFFLGAPGCGLRASLDVSSAWFVTGATHVYSLAVPNDPTLLNLNLYTTSAVFQVPPVNTLGAITANGIAGMIGNL